jgi:hypothetical protein
MQLIADTLDPADQDYPGQPSQRTPALDEYDARRCAICDTRYPPFGFGPPLTKKDAVLWACAAHRAELDRRLTERRTAPTEETSQYALFRPGATPAGEHSKQ